ncbi:unnamed protein product [marine sediment metagenome]|uniref:Uncharacterized protein n=1 Tax=marine sediment metagenome TaxID=412755 RepID=X1DBF5_9ZZZZ
MYDHSQWSSRAEYEKWEQKNRDFFDSDEEPFDDEIDPRGSSWGM